MTPVRTGVALATLENDAGLIELAARGWRNMPRNARGASGDGKLEHFRKYAANSISGIAHTA